jgi:uncharacterized protein (UPF0276 family)
VSGPGPRRIDGFGVGLRTPFARELLASERAGHVVDWIEVTPENWVLFGGRKRRILDACIERFPTAPHSVSLSLGGPDPLDADFLGAVDALCRRAGAPWWSDHLCFSSVDGAHTHDLLPLPLSGEAAARAAARAREVMARVETPFLVENITFYAHMPGGDLDESSFLARVVDEADCGLLLDVNNVWVNARNHGYDARAFIDRLPLGRVRQIHVAGHTRIGRVIVDTHIGPVIDDVWALYRHAIARIGRVVPTLVEWDQEIPALDVVLDEVDRARAECAAALAGRGGADPR